MVCDQTIEFGVRQSLDAQGGDVRAAYVLEFHPWLSCPNVADFCFPFEIRSPTVKKTVPWEQMEP